MENRSGVLGADRQNRQKRGALLLRLWRYLGRNRLLLAAAVGLSLGSNILALFGPRLAGQAINAIAAGPGRWISPLFGTGRQPWRCFTCCRPACPTPCPR